MESGPVCFQCVCPSPQWQTAPRAPTRAAPGRSYIIEHGVCYLTIADRSYPKKLAYQVPALPTTACLRPQRNGPRARLARRRSAPPSAVWVSPEAGTGAQCGRPARHPKP